LTMMMMMIMIHDHHNGQKKPKTNHNFSPRSINHPLPSV